VGTSGYYGYWVLIHLIVVEHMNRLLMLPFVAAVSLTACSSTLYRITNESLIAATPERMVVISLRKSRAMAKIIVLADQNKTFLVFRDQLEKTKAITAELNALKSFRVCDKSIRLAEFQLNGDTSLLKEITSSSEKINQFLGVPASKTQCASEILTENFASECMKRYSEKREIESCISHAAKVDFTWTHPSKTFKEYVVNIKECRLTATSESVVESCMMGKGWEQSR
jgi:hypothetical protein